MVHVLKRSSRGSLVRLSLPKEAGAPADEIFGIALSEAPTELQLKLREASQNQEYVTVTVGVSDSDTPPETPRPNRTVTELKRHRSP